MIPNDFVHRCSLALSMFIGVFHPRKYVTTFCGQLLTSFVITVSVHYSYLCSFTRFSCDFIKFMCKFRYPRFSFL